MDGLEGALGGGERLGDARRDAGQRSAEPRAAQIAGAGGGDHVGLELRHALGDRDVAGRERRGAGHQLEGAATVAGARFELREVERGARGNRRRQVARGEQVLEAGARGGEIAGQLGEQRRAELGRSPVELGRDAARGIGGGAVGRCDLDRPRRRLGIAAAADVREQREPREPRDQRAYRRCAGTRAVPAGRWGLWCRRHRLAHPRDNKVAAAKLRDHVRGRHDLAKRCHDVVIAHRHRGAPPGAHCTASRGMSSL